MINNGFKAADSSNYSKGRTQAIQFIVMHYTANDGDTDSGNASYFSGANRKASAHYFVDEDSYTQTVKDEDTAWHCGAVSYIHPICRNANSIGIEMCSDKVNGKYVLTAQTVTNAVELTQMLMKKHNIPVDRVVTHNMVTGKICPEPWVRDKAQFEAFKARLVNNTTPTQPTKPANPYTEPKTVLKQGSNGVTVKWLQFELNECGYGLVVDGDFGPKTNKAVIDFQSKNGLEVDGVVGPLTRAKLKNK